MLEHRFKNFVTKQHVTESIRFHFVTQASTASAIQPRDLRRDIASSFLQAYEEDFEDSPDSTDTAEVHNIGTNPPDTNIAKVIAKKKIAEAVTEPPPEIHDAFAKFDKDQDGAIDKTEIKEVLIHDLGQVNATNRDAMKMLRDADTNRDRKPRYNWCFNVIFLFLFYFLF